MGINYLWDTNTVIYFLQNQFSIDAELFIDKALENSFPIISAITEIELLCWKTNNENDIKVLNDFIKQATVIELEQKIKLRTASIRKNYRIKLPDAIIAATALTHNLCLITRNIKDFEGIVDLKTINPFSEKI